MSRFVTPLMIGFVTTSIVLIFYQLFYLKEMTNKFQNIKHFWMVLVNFKEIK